MVERLKNCSEFREELRQVLVGREELSDDSKSAAVVQWKTTKKVFGVSSEDRGERTRKLESGIRKYRKVLTGRGFQRIGGIAWEMKKVDENIGMLGIQRGLVCEAGH